MDAAHLFLGLVVLCQVAPSVAQTRYPNQPIRFVVPSAAGGVADLLARTLAKHLAVGFGQPMIVDNKAGAGGILGTEYAAKAPADGYTLAQATISNITQPLAGKALPYDFERDFIPVALLIKMPNVISVHPSVPATNLQELVALSKRKPGSMSYATSGLGFSPHLSGELFKSVSGADLVHIPYKGSGPAVSDVIGGQVPVLVDNATSAVRHVKSGALRALAVTSAKRYPGLPEVPTVAEAGFPGYEATGWVGLIVRSGTPPEIVERIAGEFKAVTSMPEVRKSLADGGAEVVASNPEDFNEFLAGERRKWGPVIRSIGLKMD